MCKSHRVLQDVIDLWDNPLRKVLHGNTEVLTKTCFSPEKAGFCCPQACTFSTQFRLSEQNQQTPSVLRSTSLPSSWSAKHITSSTNGTNLSGRNCVHHLFGWLKQWIFPLTLLPWRILGRCQVASSEMMFCPGHQSVDHKTPWQLRGWRAEYSDRDSAQPARLLETYLLSPENNHCFMVRLFWVVIFSVWCTVRWRQVLHSFHFSFWVAEAEIGQCNLHLSIAKC